MCAGQGSYAFRRLALGARAGNDDRRRGKLFVSDSPAIAFHSHRFEFFPLFLLSTLNQREAIGFRVSRMRLARLLL